MWSIYFHVIGNGALGICDQDFLCKTKRGHIYKIFKRNKFNEIRNTDNFKECRE